MPLTDKSKSQLADQLADERQMLRTLIDSLPDGIYVKDTQSRFVVGNKAVAELMGVKSPEELIGKTDFEFFARDLATSYYEDEQAIIRSGKSLLNREEPTFDARTGKPGWLLTSKVVWRDRNGKVAGIMGLGRNITELKEAQQALAKAHEGLEQRVEERTSELSKSKARLERIHEFFRSTLDQISDALQRGAQKSEVLEYVEQAQEQFDRIG